MKFLLLYFFLFAPKETPLLEIRKLFYKAAKSKDATIVLRDKLKYVDESEPLLLGYKAMAEMLLAKHAFNPINKINHFNNGKDLLENAIAKSEAIENIELLSKVYGTNKRTIFSDL